MIYIAGLLVSIIANAENRVALVDTGIQKTDDIKQYLCKDGHRDFTETGLYDQIGHGTEVAGLIIKNASIKNFCLVVIKFYERNLTNEQVMQNSFKAFNYAKQIGAKVINFSASGVSRSEEEASFMRNNPSLYFVVAAGNDNVDLDESPRYPASYGYDNIIVVGALNKDGTKARVSNYGTVVFDWEVATATSFATAIKTGKMLKRVFKSE